MARPDSRTPEPATPAGYDDDFFLWTQRAAALLREGRLSPVDIEHVAEEVEDMGKRDRRALESRLDVLLAHLLRWTHQPEHRSRSWRGTILTRRARIERIVRDSPSLRRQLPELAERAYQRAVALAANDTGLPIAAFPATCPWGADDVVDAGFLPG